MKKPILENFSSETLILLSKQKKDKEFDEAVRKILTERYEASNYPFFKTYYDYKKSDGLEKLACGEALATHLINGDYFIECEVLDELLPNLSIEKLWCLGRNENTLVREKAREQLFSVMDMISDEVVVTKPAQKTISKNNIIYLKRKD